MSVCIADMFKSMRYVDVDFAFAGFGVVVRDFDR